MRRRHEAFSSVLTSNAGSPPAPSTQSTTIKNSWHFEGIKILVETFEKCRPKHFFVVVVRRAGPEMNAMPLQCIIIMCVPTWCVRAANELNEASTVVVL